MTGELRTSVEDLIGHLPVTAEDDARLLYDRLADGGWTTVSVPEHLGGSGGSIADAAEVVAAVAAAGTGLPVGETAIIAGWLLRTAGLALPVASRCVVPVTGRVEGALDGNGATGLLTMRAERVAWASWASHLIVPVPRDPDRTWVVAVDAMRAAIRRGSNLAGEPRDDVETAAAPVLAAVTVGIPHDDLLAGLAAVGALTRSVQIAHALGRVASMTARFCAQRVQFGRPLSAFQAVQQQLAELAAEAAAAQAAVTLALAGTDGPRRPVLAAIAKTRTGQAAGVGARIAHQLHGAIGVTREHPLQRYTRALWSWREEFGSESYWSRYLAAQMAQAGTPLWAWVTADD